MVIQKYYPNIYGKQRPLAVARWGCKQWDNGFKVIRSTEYHCHWQKSKFKTNVLKTLLATKSYRKRIWWWKISDCPQACRTCWAMRVQWDPCSLSLWWCGGTRSGPWSHRCRSWSPDWWASGQYSGQCCCGPGTEGSSSRPSASPNSTSWWCAHQAKGRSPLCGWTHPACGASGDHSSPHLWKEGQHWNTGLSQNKPSSQEMQVRLLRSVLHMGKQVSMDKNGPLVNLIPD